MAKKPDEKPDMKKIAKQVKELRELSKLINQAKEELNSVVAEIQEYEKNNG